MTLSFSLTHIIKPEPERFPGLTANEFFCLTLAGSVGPQAPAVAMGRAGDRPYLLVERYDRFAEGDPARTVRLHQEDFSKRSADRAITCRHRPRANPAPAVPIELAAGGPANLPDGS
jgi:hypothetical protein